MPQITQIQKNDDLLLPMKPLLLMFKFGRILSVMNVISGYFLTMRFYNIAIIMNDVISFVPSTPHMIDKIQLTETCKQLIFQRIQTAELAMKSAQESSNNEDKSSAGDKYETSRAMGHLDRDMNAKQLVQAQQELAELGRIDLKPSPVVRQGSLVYTEKAVYFIAIGLGVIQFEGSSVVVLSAKSPLAQQLLGKKQGDSFLFNNLTHIIKTLV